jgi:heptosyltransferase-2
VAHVVFHTAFVGDLLLSIPFLRRIKRLWPDQPLVLVVRPGLRDLFLELNVADEILELDKKNSQKVNELVHYLNAKKIDKLFCPHESVRTALILLRLKANLKIGYQQWWNGFIFDQRIQRPMSLPEPMRVMALLSKLDPETGQQLKSFLENKQHNNLTQNNTVMRWHDNIPQELALRTPASAQLLAKVSSQFSLKAPYVVVAPSSQWITKRWTPQGFAHVIAKICSLHLNVYLVGAPNEISECENVLQQNLIQSNPACRGRVFSLAGQTTLRELFGVIAGSQAVLANDSGPMHLAAVAGRPVVAIFGPTTLELGYRPWTDESIVEQIDLPCRPCGRHGHVECPIKTHACMRQLPAEQVGQSLLQVLENFSSKRP